MLPCPFLLGLCCNKMVSCSRIMWLLLFKGKRNLISTKLAKLQTVNQWSFIFEHRYPHWFGRQVEFVWNWSFSLYIWLLQHHVDTHVTSLDNLRFTELNLVFAFAVYSRNWYLEHRMYICRNAYREAPLSWKKCGASVGSHDWSSRHSFSRIYFRGEFTFPEMLTGSLALSLLLFFFYISHIRFCWPAGLAPWSLK
jgi:hypothetical protein